VIRLLRVLAMLGAVSIVSAAAASAASADTLIATCAWGDQSQPCDSTTWYSAALTVVWSANPAPDQPTSGCELGIAYHYDTNTVTTPPISCSATWSDQTTVIKQYTVHVETSSPSATATLSRPPDSNGWYTHPVGVTFAGSSFSGIASCASPAAYSGPAASNATVGGSCTDNAGKVANATVSFKYDGIAPAIAGATASRSPDYKGWYTHPVSFTFKGMDSGSGIKACQTVTYSGPDSGWVGGGCWDQAGNYSKVEVWVPYLPDVVKGAAARVASVPLLLHWKAKSHASYYNVQIYRAGRKVLSKWPSRTSLFLSQSWRFDGHRFRLKPGHYHWYVWPGYGSRAADRYGRRIVSATFTVT
jgi:hypothetical protein